MNKTNSIEVTLQPVIEAICLLVLENKDDTTPFLASFSSNPAFDPHFNIVCMCSGCVGE
jgi:hypothetical protein